MSPADKAQIEQAKFNAKQAKTQAQYTMEGSREQVDRFTRQAEGELAKGTAILGKTGNLGLGNNAALRNRVYGSIDKGAAEARELNGIRETIAERERVVGEMNKNLENLTKPMREAFGGGQQGEDAFNEAMEKYSTGYQMYSRVLKKAQSELDEEKAKYSALGGAMEGAKEISGPSNLSKASGSDLVALSSSMAYMEEDRRTMIRQAQHTSNQMWEMGENYDEQAGYMKQQAMWNTFSSIFSTIGNTVGLVTGIKGLF